MGNSSGQLGSSTTADQAMAASIAAGANVADKVAIVTGGNTGIGLEAARTLVANKCHVVIACRDPKKGQDAVDEIKKTVPEGHVEAMSLDLADTASIRKFAADFQQSHKSLHMLINNAGIMNTPYGKTKDGFEQQLGTNVMGHMLLTELLLSTLKSSAPARVVNLSSRAHTMTPEAVDTIYTDFNMEKSYSGWKAYARSKLGNVLFSNALNRRLAGTGVISMSLHPGVIYTNLWQHSTMESIIGVVGRPFMKSVQQGAATTIFCATHPSLQENGGGKYYADCHEEPAIAKALDVKLQDDLWNICRQKLGLQTETQ